MDSWSGNSLPPDMKNSETERYDVSRGNPPPLRYIDELAKALKDSPEMAKVYTSDEVQEQVPKFPGGSAEQSLAHIDLFWAIENKLDLEGQWEGWQLQLGEAQQRRSQVNVAGQEQRDLDAEIEECERQLKECIDKAFQLFADLLTPTPLQYWLKSVKACCKTKGWIDRGGIKRNTIAGYSFPSLRRSIMHWLIAGCVTRDAAERERRYIATQLKYPQRAVGVGISSIRAYAERLMELNQSIEKLPCLKDTEGSPAEMERADKPYSKYEMCQILLTIIPTGFEEMYLSRQPKNHYPTDYDDLVDALERIEPEYAKQQEVLSKIRTVQGKAKGKTMKSIEDKIPRKQPSAPSEESSAKKQRRLCQNCAKWSPETKDSHNTRQCRKWNPDGTRKGGKHGTRNTNMHGKSDESDAMLGCFMQMQKDQQKLMKMLASKNKKKRAKKSRGYSSSDSSDSE